MGGAGRRPARQQRQVGDLPHFGAAASRVRSVSTARWICRASMPPVSRGILLRSVHLPSGQRAVAVKTVEARISERLDREIDALVEQGWFDSRDKVVQEAIRRFMEAHRPELMERFIREDVEWGLRGRS